MTSLRKVVSTGISRRYTLVEVLVVISILATLMAISSNVATKTKKTVVGQFNKITSTSLDDSFGSKGKVNDADQAKDTALMRNLSKAGMLPAKSSKNGKKADTQESVKISDRKIAALKNRTVTAVPEKRQNVNVEPKEEIAMVDFPEPEGIVPKETIITISAADAPETEIFTKFLHQNGSSATMKEYQKLWAVNVDALKEDRKFKMEQGIDITLFSQYLRKKAVFETSPYRTYVLRKKILLASRQTFDLKASTVKYRDLAEKKFKLARRGDFVQFTTVQGKEYSGTYQGIRGHKIYLKYRRGTKYQDPPYLSQIPKNQRWRYDAAALNAKKEAYVKQALNIEEERIQKKQEEYIQKTLDAEFAMLKEDPLMTNIR